MRTKSIAIILALFLGWIGGHRFYLGQIGMGLLYFFTAGLFGIGVIVDIVRMVLMSDDEFNYKYNDDKIYMPPPPIIINKTTKVADELKKLHDLKEAGIITEDEFILQKNKLLA